MAHALVVGAGGAVGEAAALALLRKGWRVTASLRHDHHDVVSRLKLAGADVTFQTLPEDAVALANADAVIFTTNLTLSVSALEASRLAPARLVVISSNNVAVDASAPSYLTLAAAEAHLRSHFPNVAIIRPTLIYGDPRLATVTALARMVERSPVLLLPGSGRARVQPVYYGDLGNLAAGLAELDAPSGIFAVGGPQVVNMRQFYEAVAAAAGRRRLVVPVPRFALGLAVALKILSPEQVNRVDFDRIAIAESAIPSPLQPCTSLAEGVAKLLRTMRR